MTRIRKLSTTQIQLAIDLFIRGDTRKQISTATGISESYIKDLLKKYKVARRPQGFQAGNPGSTPYPTSDETKRKISTAHKKSGHRPSREAIEKGQPKTLKVRWGKHTKDPVGHLYNGYKTGADIRVLEFSLTREEFEILIKQNCQYCKDPPPSARNINNSSELICNGVDRVDNKFGYTKYNSVPCCKVCNMMKSNRDRLFFIIHCKKIAGAN